MIRFLNLVLYSLVWFDMKTDIVIGDIIGGDVSSFCSLFAGKKAIEASAQQNNPPKIFPIKEATRGGERLFTLLFFLFFVFSSFAVLENGGGFLADSFFTYSLITVVPCLLSPYLISFRKDRYKKYFKQFNRMPERKRKLLPWLSISSFIAVTLYAFVIVITLG